MAWGRIIKDSFIEIKGITNELLFFLLNGHEGNCKFISPRHLLLSETKPKVIVCIEGKLIHCFHKWTVYKCFNIQNHITRRLTGAWIALG